MRRKIFSYILVSFFLLGACAYAQKWPNTVQIVEKVRTDLNLDQKQYDAVKLIIEGNIAKRKQIWAESSLGPTLAQSEDLRMDMYSQLREILTRYQMRQWKKILAVISQDMDAYSQAHRHDQPLPVN